MKKILFSAVLALPAFAFAQVGAPGSFTLNGKVGTLNAPAKALLSYRSGTTTVTDSADIKDGAFTFTGKLADPTSAQLMVRHAAPEPGKRTPADYLSLYLEPKTFSVNAADSVKNGKIIGSPINDDNQRMKDFLKPASDKMMALNKEYMSKSPEERKDAAYQKSLDERSEAISNEMNALYTKFAQQNNNSYMGLVAMRSSLGAYINYETAQPLFDKFTPAMKATTLGKTIATNIDAAKKTRVGEMAMAFTQNDPDGKPVSLADFKGKYLLIDFWASWCGPCRAENPNVVAAYNKFKDKNFTILGVSLDQPGKKDAWLKAIKDDGLTWTHVSDLQYWNNAVAKQYGIQAIPANFLLDPNGKIVARNVRGEELMKKLEELLGKTGTEE